MPRLRRLGARDVLRVLHEFGFEVVSLRGSHAKMARGVGRRKEILVVPVKRQLTVGTVHAIYRQACKFIPEDRLRERLFAD